MLSLEKDLELTVLVRGTLMSRTRKRKTNHFFKTNCVKDVSEIKELTAYRVVNPLGVVKR